MKQIIMWNGEEFEILPDLFGGNNRNETAHLCEEIINHFGNEISNLDGKTIEELVNGLESDIRSANLLQVINFLRHNGIEILPDCETKFSKDPTLYEISSILGGLKKDRVEGEKTGFEPGE